MKKKLFASAIVLSLAVAALSAQSAAGQSAVAQSARSAESGAADVVVLLDVSQSVLPYFQDVTDFVLSSVVRDFLRFGDTFHLLTFGDSAQAEIAQKMNDERDVKSVLGRLYLLYPLARYSDFLGALGHLRQYLSDLPESRRKVVVVITDGVQNPPPGSPNASMESARVAAEIESTCAGIRANGWDLHLIRLPLALAGTAGSGGAAGGASGGASPAKGSAAVQPAESGGTSYFDVAASALGGSVSDFSADGKESLARKSLALASAEFPDHLGKRGYSFSFPLKIENGSDTQVGLELEALMLGGQDVLAKKAFLTLSPGKSGSMDVQIVLPATIEPGEKTFDVELRFANGVRVSPQFGKLSLELIRMPFASFFRSGARVALFSLLLFLCLALAITILVLLKRVPRKAEAPIVAAVLDSAAERDRARVGPVSASVALPTRAATGGAAGTAAPSTAASIPSERRPEQRKTALPQLEPTAPDEHEAAIAREAMEMAKATKEESSRAADVLAQAAARRTPTAALAEFMASRTRGAEPKRRAPAEAVTPPRADVPSRADEGRIVRPGSIRVELKVEGQNPHIGMRNVHTLHAGGSKTVGGGRSDFFVFLVPTAKRAAELRYDGERLSFIPRRAELFPGTEGIVEDCLDTDILMLGRGDYPLVLRFALYERPADKINRLLRCIETPGLASGLDFEP